MKMSVTTTYDNQEIAKIALKAVQKELYDVVDDESLTFTQVDNAVTIDLVTSVYGSKIDLRKTRLNVIRFKSVIDILYALA